MITLQGRTFRTLALAMAFAAASAPLFAMGSKEPKAAKNPNSLVVAESATTVTCRDADGNELTVRKNNERVIVNYTSLVTLWYRAGGVAVGMPETKNLSDLPEAARGIASTGHTTAPNIESMLALEPGLVILASNMEKQRALVDIFHASGIETLLLSYENYGDFVGILDLFYRLNGGSMADDPLAMAMSDEVETLAAAERAKGEVRFLSLFASARDVQSETDVAHTAFIARYLGGVNITGYTAPSRSQTRLPFSIERIHMEDPDVIFVTTMGDGEAIREKMRKDFMESDVWKGLRAVREGRVYFLPNDLFLYKPNDRFPEAFRLMASYLRPAKN